MANDAVIVGGGPAGYTAAIRIAQLGGRAIVVEERNLGGVCANLGCIPTKAMQASVRLLEGMRRAERHGGVCTGSNYTEMIRRRNRVVDITVRGIERLLESYDIPVIRGTAEVISSKSVEVNSEGQVQSLEAKNVVIATGSRPQELEALKPDGVRVLTSDDVLTLDRPPASLIVVGGGAIGVEFATIFNPLGTEVTVLEKMGRLVPSEDWETSELLKRAMGRRGIAVETDCEVLRLKKEGLGIRGTAGPRTIQADGILVAVGRRPRYKAEELLRLGIKFTSQGIAVDWGMETNMKGVYAIGDVTGPPFLAHAAHAEGLVCAENIMGRKARIDLSKVPNCIYTIPEAASIGVRTNSLEDERGFKVGRSPFAANGEARARGETEGFVKVFVRREDNALAGAHIVGPGATEIVATAGLAMAMGATTDKIRECIVAHPTCAEAFIEAIRDVDGEALQQLRSRIPREH
jgi:dihydrolipoamide dehydrogenase